MKKHCCFLIVLLGFCFSSIADEPYKVCKQTLMQALSSGNGKVFLRTIEAEIDHNWLEKIPFFNVSATPPQIVFVNDITDTHVAEQCPTPGHIKCIHTALFDKHKKSFGWGCDREGKAFITIIYTIASHSGKILAVGVIQHFIQALKDKPALWISKTYDSRGKFIGHNSPFCSETLDDEELVHTQDFHILAKLILEGNVTIHNEKHGFINLFLWNKQPSSLKKS